MLERCAATRPRFLERRNFLADISLQGLSALVLYFEAATHDEAICDSSGQKSLGAKEQRSHRAAKIGERAYSSVLARTNRALSPFEPARSSHPRSTVRIQQFCHFLRRQ